MPSYGDKGHGQPSASDVPYPMSPVIPRNSFLDFLDDRGVHVTRVFYLGLLDGYRRCESRFYLF